MAVARDRTGPTVRSGLSRARKISRAEAVACEISRAEAVAAVAAVAAAVAVARDRTGPTVQSGLSRACKISRAEAVAFMRTYDIVLYVYLILSSSSSSGPCQCREISRSSGQFRCQVNLLGWARPQRSRAGGWAGHMHIQYNIHARVL